MTILNDTLLEIMEDAVPVYLRMQEQGKPTKKCFYIPKQIAENKRLDYVAYDTAKHNKYS
jgi:hypothetical protein